MYVRTIPSVSRHDGRYEGRGDLSPLAFGRYTNTAAIRGGRVCPPSSIITLNGPNPQKITNKFT